MLSLLRKLILSCIEYMYIEKKIAIVLWEFNFNFGTRQGFYNVINHSGGSTEIKAQRDQSK